MKFFSGPNSTIKRDPAHDFGVGKVVCPAAYFPDTVVRFLPMTAHVLYQCADQGPEGTIRRFAIGFSAALPPVQVYAVQHFPKNVELLLPCCLVPNTYWGRSAITTEVG